MTLKPVYDEIYTNIDYGPIATARGFLVSVALCGMNIANKKVLCIGSGNAYEAVNMKHHGANVFTMDFVAPDVECLKGYQTKGAFQHIPFKDDSFEYVVSAECLEHIDPDDIDECLSDLHRVGKFFQLTVADKQDEYGTHLCIKPIDWWMEKLQAAGFVVKNAQIKPLFTIQFVLPDNIYAVKTWSYGNGYYFQCSKN